MKKVIVLACLLALMVSIPASFAEPAQVYTGLIVDARELSVEPSISPKIYDENGNEIYGTVNIDPDVAIEKGIVQYSKTVGDAIRDSLAGDNPIVIRAVKKGSHPYKADVVVTSEDAVWILSSNIKSHFLENLKVVFII
jgi:hypothetical protein